MLDGLEDVALGFGVRRVLLVAHDGRLLQHLHGEDAAHVLAGHLAHLSADVGISVIGHRKWSSKKKDKKNRKTCNRHGIY